MESKRTRRRWTWLMSAIVVMAVTGCGMYPSKPGAWPEGPWGSVLHFISDVIDFFAHLLGNSYGLSILIVTIIVRIIILPLFLRQLRYQKMMMELQPQMQKIRAKYKGDNQKIQQETMKLYQEMGTNPVMGCLPTLIQLPVLYALYGAIMGNKGLHESTFLWIFPLGQHDPHFIMPIVAGLSTFLSSWIMMKNQPQQQRMILFIMPLFIIFIGARLPAGLVLYWIYTNLLTALQTYIFRARPAAAAARATVVDVKDTSKPTSGRKSGQKSVQAAPKTTKKSSGGATAKPAAKPNSGKSSDKKSAGKRANQSTDKPANDDGKS